MNSSVVGSNEGLRAEDFSLTIATPRTYWLRAVRLSWPLIAASALIVATGCIAGPFTYAPLGDTLQRVLVIATMLATAAVFCANNRPRTALVIECIGLAIAVAATVPGLTTMIVALDMPYRDAELLAWDKALGFDWEAIVLWVRDYPALSIVMSHCYSSILWQPMLLIPCLAFSDPERLRRIMGASTVALLVTVVVFAFYPAETGYVHLGYKRSEFPHLLANTSWGVHAILEAVRGGSRQLSLEGLVTFPSYHAVVAVLFAYGWRAVPVVRWPMIMLNFVMLIACVPIGSHYVVDVLAGIVIAFAAYKFADRYFGRTDTLPTLERWYETEEGKVLASILGRLAGGNSSTTRPPVSGA